MKLRKVSETAILPADKGNATVMRKEDNDSKIKTLLHSGTYKVLRKDSWKEDRLQIQGTGEATRGVWAPLLHTQNIKQTAPKDLQHPKGSQTRNSLETYLVLHKGIFLPSVQAHCHSPGLVGGKQWLTYQEHQTLRK